MISLESTIKPFEITETQVTTAVRWLLRIVLVVVLGWIIRRRPSSEEDGSSDDDDDSSLAAAHATRRNAGGPGRGQGGNKLQLKQQRRDSQATTVRQRRTSASTIVEGAEGELATAKLAKPRKMWEVRGAEGSPPQILRQEQSTPVVRSGNVPKVAPSTLANISAERPKVVAANTDRKKNGVGSERALHGHQRPVTFVTWNYDGNLLFTCGKDKIVCVWSSPEGELLGTYEGHNGAVWSCSATKDSRWLVTGGADSLVIVWEAHESREVARAELPGVVRSVEWVCADSCSNGTTSDRFVSSHNRFGSKPPALTVWNFDSTEITELFKVSELPTVALQVRWVPGRNTLVSSHENGELVFWNGKDGAELKRLQAHAAGISKFEFSHDGDLVATSSHDKSVRLWDVSESIEWRELYRSDADRPINAVALGKITRTDAVAAPSQRPHGCCLIAAGGQDVRQVTTTSSTSEQFTTLLFGLGSADLFPAELEPCGVTKGHFGPVHSLAFSRDGTAIASGSEDGCVRLHVLDVSSA